MSLALKRSGLLKAHGASLALLWIATLDCSAKPAAVPPTAEPRVPASAAPGRSLLASSFPSVQHEESLEKNALVMMAELHGLAGGVRTFFLLADGTVFGRSGAPWELRSFLLSEREMKEVTSVLLSKELVALGDTTFGVQDTEAFSGTSIIVQKDGLARAALDLAVGSSSDRPDPCYQIRPRLGPQDPKRAWVDIPDAFVKACRLIERLRHDPRMKPWEPSARR
jgi:hypothetical protein